MALIEKHAQRANLWSALVQRGWAAADALGVQGWISAAASTVVFALWGLAIWLYSQLPWWAFVLLNLILGIVVLRFYVELRRAWAIKGLKNLNLVEIGKDCQKFREDVFEFLVSRVELAPSRRSIMPVMEDMKSKTNAMYEVWAQGTDYSNQTRARSAQKFAHRIIALNHVLSNSGIKPPDLWGFDHNLPNIAAYIGAVGELLERGLLKEARELELQEMHRMHFYLG